ncbi:MAG: hypothetical protein ACYTG0_02090 [Planctomycetota bacterium]|jgi:hypothetical protein
MRRLNRTTATLFWVCTIPFAWPAEAGEPAYEVGGPLAGLQLPDFPTRHGEPAGHPGSIPELMKEGEAVVDMGNAYREWGPQGQAAQKELYEGSVEHWRAYMFKYMPVRSFFDRQSQLANFVAPDIPGAQPSHVETYAEPVYWVPRHAEPRFTGRKHKPVPVVRMKVDAPVLRIDLGELDEGLYTVRVVGAVETDQLRPFRKPLFMRMTVNDGLDGRTSQYRLRLGYCDEFYSVAEFFFHATARRPYRAELKVDLGSTVDLLVHNVSLDDALAGTLRRPIKTRTTIAGLAKQSPQGRPEASSLSREARLARDARVWNAFPPVNAQGSSIGVGHGGYGSIRGVSAGTDKLSGEQIVERYGPWEPPTRGRLDWGEQSRAGEVFLVNPKLDLVYTVDDLRHGRLLPDPYPFHDDGAGLYFPDPNDPAAGAAWTPIGLRVHQLRRDYYRQVTAKARQYREGGAQDDAHDAAIALVRWAYDFPTFDFSRYLTSAVRDPGPFNRDYSCRRRATAANFLPHYPLYVKPVMYSYDELFDVIRSSRLLAESVGRFVPWVKTPEDVIRLIDVYLVQTTAKRILRYHYHTDPMDVANLAAVVGNRQVTDPWMEWLFARTFIYPLPVAGIQDVMISGTTREGTEYVGSAYYSQGEGALRVAASLDQYLDAGGSEKFDLSDRRRYPKPVAHAYWRLENVVAGGDFLRVGDVCGPDKTPGHTLRDLGFARNGWRWTADPKFAFLLKHYLGRRDEPQAEWTRIERAAAEQPRAPWLEARSRVLPMWAGILEAGRRHDDYRFRRTAYLRLGFGVGHEHHDSLDLQVVAHGLPMTVDGGQRPGYSVPGDRTTRMHNLLQVDGLTAHRHSWATALADHLGARYLAAEVDRHHGVALFRRQIALIDVDEGRGSEKLPPEKQKPGAPLPEDVQTANSYVFDVVRAAGGYQHTYCFHGPINDHFDWNAQDAKPPAPGSEEAEYLSRFSLMPELSFVGDAPSTLQATWRMALEVDGPGGGEKEMLGKNYLAGAPRKFTRLHLFRTEGARAMRGEFVCRQWRYHLTNLMVQKRVYPGYASDAAHAAVIEPYAGEPFITSAEELTVEDNEHGARRAVAVGLTLPDGRRDVCFADGRPDRLRRVPDAPLAVAGEFAFYSSDDGGLRQATLVGGRKLAGPWVGLVPKVPERRGRVSRVDYLAKKLWIDQDWPERHAPGVFEIGLPGHMTTYTAAAVEPRGDETEITLARGADYFRSQITEVDAEGSTVTTALKPMVDYVDHNRAGWVASDDSATTFWRATYLGNRRFKLDGPPVGKEAFGPEGVLRLWECGVGDAVRQSTSVSLRRTEAGVFELTADVAVTISFPCRSVKILPDGGEVRPLRVDHTDGWVTVELPPRDEPIRLKVEGLWALTGKRSE